MKIRHIYRKLGGGYMFSLYMLVSDEWSGIFFIILSFIAILYGVLIKRATNLKLCSSKPLIFYTGLFLTYLTINSPLTILSHLYFSSHMLFMSIHYFIIPPLLLLGIPLSLYKYLKQFKLIRWIKYLLIQPVPALYSFAILFFVYHFQMILQTFTQYPYIHKIYLYLLFYLSMNMWRPLVYPTINQVKQKKSFIFKSSLLLMPACLFFIFTGVLNGVGHLPLQGQLTATLCLPNSDAISYLVPINNKYDPLLAALLMLAIHKVSLMSIVKFEHRLRKGIARKLL